MRRVLLLELLEERCVPVTWGTPWPDARHLSLSFVPDGTLAAGQPSTLFRTLDAVAPTAVWQREVLRAFQTWAASANIDVHVVPDGGQPLGTAGRPQGDPRFGDFRIAAVPLASDVFAYAAPYEVLGGTGSGNVLLNASTPFGLADPGREDLFTVMLHEAGHALGLGPSQDPASVMCEPYRGARAGLGAGDVAAVDALYGARGPGAAGHDSPATAAPLGWYSGHGELLSLQADGGLSTLQDRDYYRFGAPTLSSTLTIQFQRGERSLLTPRVTVYDGRQHVVATAVSTDPVGGDLTIPLHGVLPLSTYYVKVEGATQDVFSTGAYRLHIDALPVLGGLTGLLESLWESTVSTVAETDLEFNGSFATALDLGLVRLLQNEQHAGFSYKGGVEGSWDADFYSLQAPAAPGLNVMTVTTWRTENGGLLPRATVYDAHQRPVEAEVLTNENGTVTLQLEQATPGATYFIEVQGTGSGAGSVGDYFLGIDFGPRAVHLDTLAQTSLGPARPDDAGLLTVLESGLYHFVLSAEGPAGAEVDLTVSDASGAVLAQVSPGGGETSSFTLNLAPGRYQFRYQAAGRNGRPLTEIAYRLRGTRLSDGIGPQPDEGDRPSQQPRPVNSRPLSDGSSDGSSWYAFYVSGSGLTPEFPYGGGYVTW